MYEQRKSKKQRKAQPKPKVKGSHANIEVKPMNDIKKSDVYSRFKQHRRA